MFPCCLKLAEKMLKHLKKLSEQTKIDFYQLEKYIKYMGFDVTEENKIKVILMLMIYRGK